MAGIWSSSIVRPQACWLCRVTGIGTRTLFHYRRQNLSGSVKWQVSAQGHCFIIDVRICPVAPSVRYLNKVKLFYTDIKICPTELRGMVLCKIHEITYWCQWQYLAVTCTGVSTRSMCLLLTQIIRLVGPCSRYLRKVNVLLANRPAVRIAGICARSMYCSQTGRQCRVVVGQYKRYRRKK